MNQNAALCSNVLSDGSTFILFVRFRMELSKQAMVYGLVTKAIRDAGRTQIVAGSKTVLAVGPGMKINSLLHNVDFTKSWERSL